MIGMFESWWHHGLISDETLDSGLKVCPGTSFMHPTPECTKVWNKAPAEQGHINPYTIYTPTCDKESPYQRRFWTPRGRAVSCHEHFNQQQLMIFFIYNNDSF
jgi:hydroxymandelonitrile lyase/serine carboxypeptidase-like clade 2